MDPNAAAKGHTLGGAEVVSADDIRERRLAALAAGGGNNNFKSPAPGPNGSGLISSTANRDRPINVKQTWCVEAKGHDDEDDMELQAALALSLGKPIDAVVSNPPAQSLDSAAEKDFNKVNSHIAKLPSGREARIESYDDLIEEWWKSGRQFNISSFHELMWDTGLTTDNDKSRWVGQGIDFRNNDRIAPSPPGGGASMISLLTADYGPWGLTQSHGGPCGVLAAVQAELIRILLFGKRDPVDYPRFNPGTVPEQSDPFLSVDIIRQALAKSISYFSSGLSFRL